MGIITSTGTAIVGTMGSTMLQQGVTQTYINIPDQGIIEGWAVISYLPFVEKEEDDEIYLHVIHNPMIALWERAIMYYDSRENIYKQSGILKFEDYTLIISDIGQSLYMLFGRHWNKKLSEEYYKRNKIGTPRSDTPDLVALLEKYYPFFGWDLPSENNALWVLLKDFIRVYYKDLVSHFDFDKFEKGVSLDFNDLTRFMEICRQTWIWFIEKVSSIKYDEKHYLFEKFTKKYCDL